MHIRPLSAPSGSEAVPDAAGANLWRADPAFARLLPLYLPEDCAPCCSRSSTGWARSRAGRSMRSR